MSQSQDMQSEFCDEQIRNHPEYARLRVKVDELQNALGAESLDDFATFEYQRAEFYKDALSLNAKAQNLSILLSYCKSLEDEVDSNREALARRREWLKDKYQDRELGF